MVPATESSSSQPATSYSIQSPSNLAYSITDPHLKAQVNKVRKIKREEFNRRLILCLTALFYAFLLLVYFSDTSIFWMFLRFIGQISITAPVPPATRIHPFHEKVILIIMFFVNGGCILTHLLGQEITTDTEISQGYLHGGLTLEIIGEQPKPRSALIYYDLILLSLQILIFSIKYPGKETPAESPIEDDGYSGKMIIHNVNVFESLYLGWTEKRRETATTNTTPTENANIENNINNYLNWQINQSRINGIV